MQEGEEVGDKVPTRVYMMHYCAWFSVYLVILIALFVVQFPAFLPLPFYTCSAAREEKEADTFVQKYMKAMVRDSFACMKEGVLSDFVLQS